MEETLPHQFFRLNYIYEYRGKLLKCHHIDNTGVEFVMLNGNKLETWCPSHKEIEWVLQDFKMVKSL